MHIPHNPTPLLPTMDTEQDRDRARLAEIREWIDTERARWDGESEGYLDLCRGVALYVAWNTRSGSFPIHFPEQVAAAEASRIAKRGAFRLIKRARSEDGRTLDYWRDYHSLANGGSIWGAMMRSHDPFSDAARKYVDAKRVILHGRASAGDAAWRRAFTGGE